jgi:hypothetical protein
LPVGVDQVDKISSFECLTCNYNYTSYNKKVKINLSYDIFLGENNLRPVWEESEVVEGKQPHFPAILYSIPEAAH